MSSRGVGNINERQEVDDYKLVAVDAVWNPSGKLSDGSQCFINGIYESKNYMVDQYGYIVEMAYTKLDNTLANLPRHSEEKNKIVIEALKDFMKAFDV
jgi:hypothetical protein